MLKTIFARAVNQSIKYLSNENFGQPVSVGYAFISTMHPGIMMLSKNAFVLHINVPIDQYIILGIY